MTENNGISLPKALAVYDRHLYYLDPRYDKLERVNLEKVEDAEIIRDNEADLRYFTVFKKRERKFNTVKTRFNYFGQTREICNHSKKCLKHFDKNVPAL